MSKEIGQMIDRVKSFSQFINESKNNNILDVAKKYLINRKIDTKQLETDNAGGMCWWFAQDFSKYLTKKDISNKVVNMTGNKGKGNHMVVKVGNDFIDFTFNQFDNDDVPVIKKQSDYNKYYDNFEEFSSFNDYLKKFDYDGEDDDEWKNSIIKNKYKKPKVG